MFEREEYGKILVPLITPFKEDQSVDYEAILEVAFKLIDENKADSIILTGTTGEFFTMSFDERVKIFEIFKEKLQTRIPLIAGTGSASTKEAIALSKKAEELGYKLVMVVTPYYTRPSQEELISHFKKIAESITIDLIVYNIPIFSGVNIEPETLMELAGIGNIVGIKEEAEINPKQITDFINATPQDFVIYCGDDTMILETYAQGGNTRIGGVVSGGAHLIGSQIRRMIDLFIEGKVEEAARMQQSYYPLFRALSPGGRTNPVCLLKDALKMIGYNAGIPRLPLTPGTEKEKVELERILRKLKIIT